jgi:hypothetical protein
MQIDHIKNSRQSSDTVNTDLVLQRRKIPRCVLGLSADRSIPLWGVKAVWEDRTETDVFDLSLTGIVLARTGVLAQMLTRAKKGQVIAVTLRFEGLLEKQTLSVRILDLDGERVLGMLDSIDMNGRLQLGQDLKDEMVVRNWSRVSPQELELQYRNSYWYHGPFDTNLVITSDVSGLIEYDGLLLKWAPQGQQFFRAPASSADGELYSHLWTTPPLAKISAGASWKQRWFRLMESVTRLDSQAEMMLKKTMDMLKSI